jgi:hypothetical protein
MHAEFSKTPNLAPQTFTAPSHKSWWRRPAESEELRRRGFGQLLFLNRRLVLPVSTMSQWWQALNAGCDPAHLVSGWHASRDEW